MKYGGLGRRSHHQQHVAQVALGQVLHQIDELLPANSLPWDDIFAAVLLVFFGIKNIACERLPGISFSLSPLPCSGPESPRFMSVMRAKE